MRRAGTAALWAVCLVFLLPFLAALVTAFRSAAYSTRTTVSDVLSQIHYAHSVVNTLLIMGFSGALVTVIAGMASYPLGRITAGWSTLTYRLFVLGAALPVFVVVAPLYLLMRDLHLLDSRVGVAMLYTALNLPAAVLFYTGFVRRLPPDLEEAAACDGCGPFRTYFWVVLPLLRPVTGALLAFVSLQIWNDLVIPLVFLGDPAKRTVMANAYPLFDPHLVEPAQLMTAVLLGAVPVIAVFLVLQRTFADRISSTLSAS